MEYEGRGRKRMYFGIFLILIGLIWIAKRLDMIPDRVDDVLISWQMLLVGIGVFSLLGGNRTSGTILIIIGGFFMIPELLNVPYEIRRIGWPLLIVGIGLIMLFRHRRRDDPVIGQGTQSLDYFDDFVVFGGRESFITSQNLLGGKVTSVFGGAEYDFRRAKLSPNGAIIDSVSIFGGSGFKIPPDWTVKNEVTTIMGGFTDKRGSVLPEFQHDPSKTLIIRGFTMFGGVEVKLA